MSESKKNFNPRLINDDVPHGQESFEGSIGLYLAARSVEFVSLKRVLLFQAISPNGQSANPASGRRKRWRKMESNM